MTRQLGDDAEGGETESLAQEPAAAARFEASFPADDVELAPIRHRLGTWLRGHGLTRRECDDLLLVASELLTNAVEASPHPQAVVRLDARLDEPGRRVFPDGHLGLPHDGCIEFRVSNEGAGFEFRSAPAVPATQLRGRGLFLVDTLSDGVHVVHDGRSTTVVAHRWLAPRSAPVAAS